MFRKFLPISGYDFSLFFFIGDGGNFECYHAAFPTKKNANYNQGYL